MTPNTTSHHAITATNQGCWNEPPNRLSLLPESSALLAWIVAFVALIALLVLAAVAPPAAHAQGSRKDDIVLGPTGHPVAGATVTVCQSTATGTPCSPLATLYTDATLTTTAPNPFQSDGIGNYHFYAPAGRYMIQISGPSISGTITYPDVILPADLSSTAAGNNIFAYGLTLGGSLSVAGKTDITGTLTAGSFNPGALSPSTLAVTGDECAAGPRPSVNVTCPPYSAKGDNSTDDTAAITGAINAACSTTIGGVANHPDVFFPPGVYHVAQTQGSSTTADLPTCSGLHLVGAGFTGSGAQFITGPQAEIAIQPGSSPSAAPVFYVPYPQNGVTFENLTVAAYNQGVWLNASTEINFKNTCISTGATADTDNTPLKITGGFYIWFKGGCLQAGGQTSATPVAIIDQEVNTNPSGLIFFSDFVGTGGGFQYIQRVADAAAPDGDIVFRNVLLESSATDFFALTDPGSFSLPSFDAVTIDHCAIEDPTGSNQALINYEIASWTLSVVYINHSYSSANTGVAIRMTNGTLAESFVFGCESSCNTQVVNSSGVPSPARPPRISTASTTS